MRTKILKALENNANADIQDLAVILGMNVVDLGNEIAECEREKIICGYHTLINWDRTEVEKVTALIEVKVTPQRGIGFDKIAERIYRFREVSSVYLMSGGFDLTVIIEGKTMKEVALFVSQKLAPLENVLSTATCFVLKKYKDDGVIFEEPTKDERMSVSP